MRNLAGAFAITALLLPTQAVSEPMAIFDFDTFVDTVVQGETQSFEPGTIPVGITNANRTDAITFAAQDPALPSFTATSGDGQKLLRVTNECSLGNNRCIPTDGNNVLQYEDVVVEALEFTFTDGTDGANLAFGFFLQTAVDARLRLFADDVLVDLVEFPGVDVNPNGSVDIEAFDQRGFLDGDDLFDDDGNPTAANPRRYFIGVVDPDGLAKLSLDILPSSDARSPNVPIAIEQALVANEIIVEPPVVIPVPPALPLMLGAIGIFVLVGRRKRADV